MKIPLSQIKPSSKPIRSSWDEPKIQELMWSLMEEGQVEPIGVYSEDHGYRIVWGHRRVEAARRASWPEIEAVIVPQDEVNNLIQAGIENLAGEDMTDKDKAEWVYRLNIEHGLSLGEISRRSSVGIDLIRAWSNMRKQEKLGVEVRRVSAVFHVQEISKALGDDLEGKKAVAAKVSDDDFGPMTTRELARAYRDAPTPEVKKKILEVPVMSRDTAADILRRARMASSSYDVHEFDRQQERKAREEYDLAVKEFLNASKIYREFIQTVPDLVKFNKFSPEAADYTIRRLEELRDEIDESIKELRNVA